MSIQSVSPISPCIKPGPRQASSPVAIPFPRREDPKTPETVRKWHESHKIDVKRVNNKEEFLIFPIDL